MCLDSGRPWSDLVDLAVHAESIGVSRLYVCDHFMPYRADERPASGPMLEAWSVLTALAMATTTVELAPLVLGMTYRHPCVVANMAATLDHVSAGRLVLGLGAGWQVNEHVAYGIPLREVGARLSQFAEACAIIRGMLRGESPTFDGRYFRTV